MGIQTFEEYEVYTGLRYEGFLQTSVLNFALTVSPSHVTFGSLSGANYSGNDLPNDNYKIGTFYVNSRTNNSKVVFIVPDDTTYTPVYNVYTSEGWSGWKSLGSGGGGSITVDSQLSATSTNPVQNRVITGALNNKADISAIPTELSDLINDVGYITSISNTDVINALGYTPYNSNNPNGYITGINSSDVTTALGYTPYNASNPAGYISSIDSNDVTGALGYVPYNSSNPDGYITGINSGDVTAALGYTPYNASNPAGYVTSSALDTKQDVLTAGTGIDITNNVISSWNISVGTGNKSETLIITAPASS